MNDTCGLASPPSSSLAEWPEGVHVSCRDSSWHGRRPTAGDGKGGGLALPEFYLAAHRGTTGCIPCRHRRFDVRDASEYAAGHIPGFRHYPGGQLVQEIDMAAPVRGARILLTDNKPVRADMTASWLAQMGWDTYVLEGGYDRALEQGPPETWPKPDPSKRYRRPYEGTDVAADAMQAYLDWEYGLVDQLRRDATHGFFVI